MRRLQLVEFHDRPWFPSFLREEVTDALRFGLCLAKVYAPIAPLLQKALDATGSGEIVDLCSGSGGPWPKLSRRLHGNGHGLQIWFTDRSPNRRAFGNSGGVAENEMRFYAEPVDARNVPRELRGFRTMFTSFHHFSPAEACAVLQNAVDAREGIGVFEITRRAPAAMGLMFVWVVLLFLCTPAIRPFRLSRLFWTYVVPVIPLVLLFDGIVSCLRSYEPSEMREIVQQLGASGYDWEIGERESVFGWLRIAYVIGCSRASLHRTGMGSLGANSVQENLAAAAH